MASILLVLREIQFLCRDFSFLAMHISITHAHLYIYMYIYIYSHRSCQNVVFGAISAEKAFQKLELELVVFR